METFREVGKTVPRCSSLKNFAGCAGPACLQGPCEWLASTPPPLCWCLQVAASVMLFAPLVWHAVVVELMVEAVVPWLTVATQGWMGWQRAHLLLDWGQPAVVQPKTVSTVLHKGGMWDVGCVLWLTHHVHTCCIIRSCTTVCCCCCKPPGIEDVGATEVVAALLTLLVNENALLEAGMPPTPGVGLVLFAATGETIPHCINRL